MDGGQVTASPPLRCPACEGTGFLDYAGFAIDRCLCPPPNEQQHNAPRNHIRDLTKMVETLQANLTQSDKIMSAIAIQSNPDWIENRADCAMILDHIHRLTNEPILRILRAQNP
jgi:hypothetical protein